MAFKLFIDLDAIITRNIKDYKNATISVMTPLTFIKMKDNAGGL